MEYPILFSGPMVKATLEGRKTQTRRVCKDQGDVIFQYVENNQTFPEMWDGRKSEPYTGWVVKYPNLPVWLPRKCPYGQPGDSLWVRETWAAIGWAAELKIKELSRAYGDMIVYKASCDKPLYHDWRPSIHMPRWASRLTLKVKNVRVERLQDISEGDAIAEGLTCGRNGFWLPGGYSSPVLAYRDLWDSIYAKQPGFTWQDNPHVWVIEFERVE